MPSSDFTSLMAGQFVVASDALGSRGSAFLPDPLPPAIDLGDRTLRPRLSEADQELARLDGMASQIDRPDLLLSSSLRNEAVLSNAIEGTHTTLADLALFEVSGVARNNDEAVVSSYVDAFTYGRERIADLPIGATLFAELHNILMRAEDRSRLTPGRYRDVQVFVRGADFDAHFVPPPSEHVPSLMDDLERYLANDEEPALIKLAIAHYQFETIHPFRDGNGRLGRLMISLWLERARILTAPMLYLSAFFERNRQEYYELLLRVSTHGDWLRWIDFFLRGVAEQSRDATRRAGELLRLRDDFRRRIARKRVPQGAGQLIDALFITPVMSVPRAIAILGVTAKPARNTIQILIDSGILSSEAIRRGTTIFYISSELTNLTRTATPSA